MAPKLPGFNSAIGAWTNPWKTIECNQVPAKVRVWQQDQLVARGQAAWLYQPVTPNAPGVVVCTCVKDGNSVADRPCLSCYGNGLVPGFFKFLHQTVWASSAEAGGYVLTNIQLDTSKKPHRLVLTPGQLTGTVITTAKSYTNPDALDWEVRVDDFIRETGNVSLVDFSTNGGVSWVPITAINGPGKPVGTGSVMFRITLSRAAVTNRSPAFEILRIRRVLRENANLALEDARSGDEATTLRYEAGQILLLRTWIQTRPARDPARGVTMDWQADRAWTAPLDFFDLSLTRDTPPCRVDDSQTGTHPFYELAYGVKTGDRLVMTAISYADNMGIFTHQTFADRRAQTEEVYAALVF